MVGIAIAFGGIGLMSSEGSSTWWSLRPLWVLILAAALLVLIGVFGWFETWSTHRSAKPPGPALSMCGATDRLRRADHNGIAWPLPGVRLATGFTADGALLGGKRPV